MAKPAVEGGREGGGREEGEEKKRMRGTRDVASGQLVPGNTQDAYSMKRTLRLTPAKPAANETREMRWMPKTRQTRHQTCEKRSSVGGAVC